MLETGERGAYQWFVGRIEDGSLPELVLACHTGLRLGVSAFDSGALHPGEEEGAGGWTVRSAIALSPPLRAGLTLPHDGFDEWYVFDEASSPDWSPEVFVNFGSFTVAPVEEMERRRDPTWERGALDWLIPVQERFWAQLDRVNPLSYVAMGDSDVIVTRNRSFAAKLSAAR